MARDGETRRLAAILMADVVGYSRLMADDEAATVRTLEDYRAIMAEHIEAHEGRVVDAAGDALLAEFASPVEALSCAAEIQRKLATRNSQLAGHRRMDMRIGIDLSDVLEKDGALYGDGVNVAARLESLAEPGGICLSAAVHDQVVGKVEIGFEDLGEQHLKNIDRPVRVHRALLDGVAASRAAGASRPAPRPSWLAPGLVAVLAVLVGAAAVIGWWRPWAPDRESASETSAIFPQIARPTRHFRVESSAELAGADTLTIYDRIRDEMAAVYRQSGDRHSGVYQTWRRYNLTPYVSATHGSRYVNNYANPQAEAYGQFENAGTLPQGSVMAKDSFEVTDRGDVLTGPLALMEKMQPGFNPESRNWRYMMIMPDGKVFGTTNGEGSERVEFCAECHLAAGEENDHLFFIPEKYRVRFLKPSEAVQ